MDRLIHAVINGGLSELIVFFIIAATMLLPWYKLISQDKHTKRAEYDAREDKLLSVIKDNTIAITELRHSIAESSKANNELLIQVASSYATLAENIDTITVRTDKALKILEECLDYHKSLDLRMPERRAM